MFDQLFVIRQTESGSDLVELFDTIADAIYASCPVNMQREIALSCLTNALTAALSSLLLSGEQIEQTQAYREPETYQQEYITQQHVITPTLDVNPQKLPSQLRQQVQQRFEQPIPVQPQPIRRVPTVQPTIQVQPKPKPALPPEPLTYKEVYENTICPGCQGPMKGHAEQKNIPMVEGRFLRMACDRSLVLCF